MPTLTYQKRRGQLQTYFDRTAVDAWARLTSTDPVSGIRATVRAGRETMRRTLLDWLPEDLSGSRLLDAGCGTGALAIEAAKRGADVVAIDLSPELIQIATERAPAELGPGRIAFRVGDMIQSDTGVFDHTVAMDSLIHYRADDAVRVLSELAARTRRSLLFTFAPRTPALTAMHAAGRLFPRGNRAPSIQPTAEARLRRLLARQAGIESWRPNRTRRVANGFYTSQAMELVRS